LISKKKVAQESEGNGIEQNGKLKGTGARDREGRRNGLATIKIESVFIVHKVLCITKLTICQYLNN